MSAAGSDEDDTRVQPDADPAAAAALPADAQVTAPTTTGAVAASSVEAAGPAAAGAADASGPSGAADAAPSGDGPGGLDAVIAKLPIDAELVEEKPEILVAGAFVAGFLVARLLKAIGRS